MKSKDETYYSGHSTVLVDKTFKARIPHNFINMIKERGNFPGILYAQISQIDAITKKVPSIFIYGDMDYNKQQRKIQEEPVNQEALEFIAAEEILIKRNQLILTKDLCKHLRIIEESKERKICFIGVGDYIEIVNSEDQETLSYDVVIDEVVRTMNEHQLF